MADALLKKLAASMFFLYCRPWCIEVRAKPVSVVFVRLRFIPAPTARLPVIPRSSFSMSLIGMVESLAHFARF